jgi:hypothetical protein
VSGFERRNLPEIRDAATGGPIGEGPFEVRWVPVKMGDDEHIASHYLEAMEWTLQRLTSPPLNLELHEKLLRVYLVPPEDLVGGDPFYEASSRTILLPIRTHFADTNYELKWMTAAAIHETAHAVCHIPLDNKIHIEPWYWLCEAFAVWVETLHPGSNDYVSYAYRWCVQPDLPLPDASYYAFPFLTYLLHHFGEEVFGPLWRTDHKQNPWESILAVVFPNDAAARDLFFMEYCIDCYFPFNAVTQAVFDRFGPRRSSHVDARAPGTHAGRVEPLACRYYLVSRSDGLQSICVTVEGPEASRLAVGAAQVGPNHVKGKRLFAGHHHRPEVTMDFEESKHIIIAVTNGGAGSVEYALKFFAT